MPSSYSNEDAWKKACDEADRLDPGWRWDELQARRPLLPCDGDAIQVALAAFSKLPAALQSLNAIVMDHQILRLAVDKKHEFVLDHIPNHMAAFQWQFTQDLGGSPRSLRLKRQLLQALRQGMASAVESKEFALRLIGLPAGRAPIIPRPLIRHLPAEVLWQQQAVAKMLRLSAILSAEEGQPDDALRCGQAIIGITKSIPQPAMLFTALASTASRNALAAAIMRTLAISEPCADSLEMTQRDVQMVLDEPLMLEAMRGERAFVEDTQSCLDDGRFTRRDFQEMEAKSVMPRTIMGKVDRVLRGRFIGKSRKRHAAKMLSYYSAIVELLKESPYIPTRYPRRLKSARKAAGLVVALYCRFIPQMLFSDRRQRAVLSCIVSALAVERFRIANGRWPTSLSEAVPSFLQAVPLNPYSLRPLDYQTDGDGITIQALGNKSVYVGGFIPYARGFNRGDIVVRLWNVERRKS
jgi:hypothetical protein